MERLNKYITVREGNGECEVDCGQCVVGQTLDKLVRSLLHLEDPHGNCAVCLDSTVHGHVGDHKLQPAGRIGLHYTQAGYKFGFGGAARRVSYLRNICKNRCKKKKNTHFLSLFSQISCDQILTHHFEE